MNNNILIILFLLQKSRINKQGLCPIRCRITYLKQRNEFSTGLFVNPKYWDSKLQKAKPPNEENNFINNELSLIKNKINKSFFMLQIQENEFVVNDVFRSYKGEKPLKQTTTIEYYNQYLEKFKKLIGIEIKQVTWSKFDYIRNDLKSFILWKFKQKDILLKDLDMAFLSEFEYYLKTEKLQKQITINKVIQRFKKVIKTAVSDKIIESNPFTEHKPKRVTNNITFLTPEELKKLEEHNFSSVRLKQVADMFIFCCYTGLAYNEMNKLENKHIEQGFDGNQWINMVRDKTERIISVPLLSKAIELIEKYNTDKTNAIFPSISNQKFNSYLKEITDIVGIEKNLTHHIARKTFATTVLLYNDVPMEIVSELLGHSKISTTQEHYAKVVQKKVSEHISILRKKLE